MPVTENTVNLFTQVVPDGTHDWDSKVSFPNGMKVYYILFYPSAANDVICIKEGSDTGPIIFQCKAVNGVGLWIKLPANLIHPYLDQSACTFSTPANVVLTFYQA